MARNPDRLFSIITNLVPKEWGQYENNAILATFIEAHWIVNLQYQSHLQSNVPQQSRGKWKYWSPVNCFAVKPEVMTGQYYLG